MNYSAYIALFENILNSENPQPPYDQAEYMVYTKTNLARMRRWDKTMKLDGALVEKLQNLDQKQHWIIIVEPWCGDAAHILPFLVRLADISKNITYELQLRDSKPYLIESYLTNGGKSIPKLIVRDAEGEDIYTWGPRPKEAQVLMSKLKEADTPFEKIKLELQTWYNKNKGTSLFKELLEFYK